MIAQIRVFLRSMEDEIAHKSCTIKVKKRPKNKSLDCTTETKSYVYKFPTLTNSH